MDFFLAYCPVLIFLNFVFAVEDFAIPVVSCAFSIPSGNQVNSQEGEWISS